jgi:acyl-CoA hydrolase
MQVFTEIKSPVDYVIEKLGKKIVLGTPLGAGKANTFINALYLRAKKDPTIDLTILTALTLEIPKGKSEIEKRFLGPISERVFGNYPDLEYELDRSRNKSFDNIKVIEFYYPPGKFLSHPREQQNYLSTNYTHAARDVLARGVNLVCQQVCKGEIDGEEVFSLSCNPDITKDIIEGAQKVGREVLVIGQVNQDLPFMYGESIVGPDFFNGLIDNRELDFKVFGPPKMSVSDADYMIGLYASTLVKDNGELQIGIGSLGDSLVYSLCQRHQRNQWYQDLLKTLNISGEKFPIIVDAGQRQSFDNGLFAATEMFVDGFAELYKVGILKKKVYDSTPIQRLLNQGEINEKITIETIKKLLSIKAISQRLDQQDLEFLKDFGIIKNTIKIQGEHLVLPGELRIHNNLTDSDSLKAIEEHGLGERLRNGAVAHAGFFLGPRAFYQFLKDLPIEERKLIRMKRISQINQLFGHEEIDRLQRINGRFINTCMVVSLNGAASSDALDNLKQVSGVGGQYNFVAMAHELPDARSILQLRSARVNQKGEWVSNICFHYANCTIPRHLRDLVITEYGIADLRAKTDEEVAIELIKIADSRFQQSLLSQAKKAGKIRRQYQLPEEFKNNYPQILSEKLAPYKAQGDFPAFPFGTDFTAQELRIGKVLKHLKVLKRERWRFLRFVWSALLANIDSDEFDDLLKRMQLANPKNIKEKLLKKILEYGFKTILKN